MDYYEGVSQGDYYLCDRCEITRLSYDEYSNNVRDIVSSDEKMRYCDECRNYMTLNKWECDTCKSTGSIRSERILHKTCCGKEVL